MFSQPSSGQERTREEVGSREWVGPFETSASRIYGLIAVLVVIVGLIWRLWLAHATFLNTDEAWHFSAANQNSLLAAYRASLTLAHPPLLIIVLYFWKYLGTSDLMLRLPEVLAGTVFCWVFFQWLIRLFGDATALVGLIFASLLPPMIALSAEIRQYSLMLMFAVAAAYFLERAFAKESSGFMVLSFLSLYFAMLSHYSAFLLAAALGIYGIARMVQERPSPATTWVWATGQLAGVALAYLLYATHISRLSAVYPATQPLQRFGDFYLSDWYFHPVRDGLLHFLYRGTFGVFRFIFGQTGVGQIAAVLFLAGIVVMVWTKSAGPARVSPRLTAILFGTPFVLNWIAVIAGLYPYGRTRQCMFLAMFALGGVSVAIAAVLKNRVCLAASTAILVIAICHLFGTLQGRDMLPLAEQRHEHMDEALQFIRSGVSARDVIFTDQASSFQLRHYLCHQKPVDVELLPQGLAKFQCEGITVIFTGANDGALTADVVVERWIDRSEPDALTMAGRVWVVQAGWASGLGEALRRQFPWLAHVDAHSFGKYIEIFPLPPRPWQRRI